MGRKVFHVAKLRSKFETNKHKHSKVAIFFLRVKNRISKEENSNKKEVLSSIEERKQYFCMIQKRERKYLPKFFPSSPSFLSIFSITPLGVFLFVCSFVCLFVKCAYAREETCASSSFAGYCIPSKSTKRHKKREKQQNTRASSSFAGYSTRFRGTYSLFLARKTLENDFTHWNIVQMKIFQGLYSRISRSERWVFFFWLKFDFFLFKERFFVHFAPTFRFPKNNFIPSLPCFSPPPPKHQYIIHKIPFQRRAINNKRGSIDNTYIKRKLRIKKKKTTCKTRRNNT